jgi:hypothetical protein
MSLMDDSRIPVHRIRPATKMDGRDTVKDYGPAATSSMTWVIVQPVTGREDQQGGRDATLAQYSVIDEDGGPGYWRDDDLVEFNGVRYQIEGHVQEWPNPLPHSFFLINRWEG